MKWKLLTIALLLFANTSFAADPPPASGFRVVGQGICEDVGKPCLKLVPADTEIFYAVFEDGKMIALTKVDKDGKETTVWGKLPLKVGEQEL